MKYYWTTWCLLTIFLGVCPSVRGLKRILDVGQTCAESHGIIFNCSKTACMTFKTKSAKSTVIPLLTLDGQSVKSVNHYKYLGLYSIRHWAINIVMTETFRDNCNINIVQQTSCELFPDVQTRRKLYFFVPSVRLCMHHNYGVISGRHTCRDCA